MYLESLLTTVYVLRVAFHGHRYVSKATFGTYVLWVAFHGSRTVADMYQKSL
jgi:hypothetical protein